MPSARAEQVRLERIRDLYGAPGSPTLAGAAAAAVVAVQAAAWCFPLGDPAGASLWAGIVLLAELGLALLIRSFHARPRLDAELPAWGAARAAAEGAHGVTWALMPLLALDPTEPLTLLPMVATLAPLVAAASAGLAAHLPSMLAFVFGALAPAAVILLLRDGRGETFAAGMMVTSFIFTMLNGLRMSVIYRQLIESRLDLADQLEVSRRLREEAEAARHDAEVARGEAERAVAERTRFFGAASHDLRQPVHALGLYASLLRNDPPKRERRDVIDRIGACVDGLESLFNAILSIARPISEAGSAAPGFAVRGAIERVLPQFWPEAERRGLTVDVRAPADVWVRGDAHAVERILANLVSNAVRYTERGGVLIRARCVGDRVRIAVADSGVGVGPADAERIFEPFYRAPGGTGHGLGLATVRELCRAHGFHCGVRSRPGRGSVFTLVAPRAPAQALPVAGSAATALPTGLRVLLVEDDSIVMDAATRILRAWGLDVVGCRTGDAALGALHEAPDARWHVLLDYRLARGETGLQVADRIRAAFGEEIPITLITGEADAELAGEVEARRIPVLRKPLKPIRLNAALRAAASAEA